ncbi:kielin/chordin-like protein [Liolophura sinensis]|uniref:kielin/chordin-like protein n=1 Tax=Liolophura sinensis TaxID=3198878 RepID=UPI003158BEB1
MSAETENASLMSVHITEKPMPWERVSPGVMAVNSCFCDAPNSVGCTEVYCPHCQYNGNIYKPGDSFNSTDGCNTCSCSENGQVACTEMACLPGPDCQYNGNIYKPGDSFNSTDGCNTCSCSESGQVACTQMACPIDQNRG